MSRISSGSVYRRADSDCWYIQFSIEGDLKRESAGTSDREEAIAFLQRRLDEARHGRYVDVDRRPTFADLERMLLENYEFKRNRTDPRRHVRRLAEMFGDMKAEEITEVRIREYSQKRLKQDRMTPATLRRELALLKRMLQLAAGGIPRVPLVDLPRVDNARQGFFEEKDVEAILPHLPPHAQNLIEFLYLTGWRSSEAFRLVWTDVNWDRQFVWLRDSKNREPRIFPWRPATICEPSRCTFGSEKPFKVTPVKMVPLRFRPFKFLPLRLRPFRLRPLS